MAQMSLDTAIRLSAQVQGGGAIDRVKRSLQDLGKSGQTTKMDMVRLEVAARNYSRANDQTIGGIRNSINAFRGLQEQAKIGSAQFKRYGDEISRLEGKLKGLDGAATAAGTGLGQKLAAGLAAAGTGRALQGITAQAGRFDAEVRKAAAIEGGSGSFGVLRKEIEAVAAAAAGTPTEVAALATALSRAGFSAKETTEALAGIVRGAEATSVTFEEMGSIAADNLRAFGLQTVETGRVVDVLTQTSNKSNQTVLDLGESLKYAAPIARNLGVPLEDLAATMALLANNGIRGSDAGTALRTGLTRLQIAASGSNEELEGLTRGNELLALAMRSLGSEIIDAQGNLLPMDQVILSLRKNIQALSAGRRAEIAKALFGDEAGSKFLALLNSSEEQIKSMFGAVRDSGGVAEATQKKMQGFDYAVKVLGGNVEYLTNQIGGMIGAALMPFISGLNGAIGAAQQLPEPIKQVGAAAAAAGLAVTGLVLGIAAFKASLAIVGGVTGLSAALTAAAGTAKAFAAALLLNPWVAAAAGVAALTVVAYNMNKPFQAFVDSYPARFKIFWSELGSDATAIVQRITGLAQGISNFIGSVITRITQGVQRAVQNIINSVGFLGPAIQTVASGFGSMFSAAFSFIESSWQQTIANMINYSNPLLAIFKLLGIDVGGAAASAMNYRPSQQPSTPTRFVPPAPPAPMLPSSGASAAASGGGGGGGGGARQTSIEDRIAARPFGRQIIAAAKANNIDAALFAALVEQESGNRQTAISRSGAIGLSQLMPGTARELGVNPNDPLQNLMGGARYLRQQLDKFGLEGGLRAYNQGPGAQQRTPGGNSQESREYPGKVLGRYRQLVGADGHLEGLQAEGIQAQQEAAEQLAQKQADATKSLKEFVEERVNAVTQATKESELLQATTDEQRRLIEYEYERNDIADRYNKLKDDAKKLAEEASAVGVQNNEQEQLARINAEERQVLANAQLKLEQDLNKIYEERAVLMKEIRNAAAMPTVYNELETQKAALDEILQKYPAIGGAADAAANLATRGMAELVTGTKNAKEVFVDFLNSMASALMDAAQKMIAQYIAIGIAKMFAGMGSSVGGFQGTSTGPFNAGNVGSFGFDPSAMLAPRAIGGPVTAGQPYPVGERGPELFVPYQSGTILTTAQTQSALSPAVGPIRQLPNGGGSTAGNMTVPFQRGAAGSAVLTVPFQRGGSNDDGAGSDPGSTIDVKFETVRIGEMDFVTRDEAQKMSRQAANQGAEIAQRRMKNNPTVRRSLGMA